MKKTNYYLVVFGVQIVLSNDIFNKNIGLFLEEVDGIINTGDRRLKVHLFDTFNHTVNGHHSNCKFSNKTRLDESKAIFRKMADELFTLHGYDVKHSSEKPSVNSKPSTTTKTPTTTTTTTTTLHKLVNTTMKAPIAVTDQYEHFSSFRSDRQARVAYEIEEDSTQIIQLEQEIYNYTRKNSSITREQCTDDCIYWINNLEMLTIDMNKEGDKHVRIKLILPLSEEMIKSMDSDPVPYMRNQTEINQSILGVPFAGNLVLIAVDKDKNDQEFDISANVEGQFLIIRMEAVIFQQSLTGSIAWTKSYQVDQISMSFMWQDMIHGYLDLEYDAYNSYYYLETRKRRETSIRKRRNIFNIAYLDDVDRKIETAMRLATHIQYKQINSLKEEAISKLADQIKMNGIAIAQEGNTISNLIGNICKMTNSIQSRFIQQDIKLHIMQILNHLLEALHDCRKGNFPQSLVNILLGKLCHLHIKKHNCVWAKPMLREFITCSLGTIYIGSKHVMIDMSLNVPQNLQDIYKLYKPYTIPVFFNESATEIRGLTNSIILEWSSPPEYQILKDCEKHRGQYICGTKSNTTPGLLDCVGGAVRNSPNTCPLDAFNPQSTCFVVKTNHGILVSTMKPIALHKEDRRRIFQSKTEKVTGTQFIPNQKSSVQSINCEDVTVYTSQTEDVNVEVVHNINFVWDRNWTGAMSRFNKIEQNFESKQNSMKDYLAKLNLTVDEIKKDMNSDSDFVLQFIPEKPKSKKFMLGVTVTLVSLLVLGTIILIIYCKYCKTKRYRVSQPRNKNIVEMDRIKRASRNQRPPYGYPMMRPIHDEGQLGRLAIDNSESTYI